jgi:dCTP deaminase
MDTVPPAAATRMPFEATKAPRAGLASGPLDSSGRIGARRSRRCQSVVRSSRRTLGRGAARPITFRPPIRLASGAFSTRPESPMSIQNDRWITQMAKEHGMIEPFEDRQVRQGVISYGVSSYGYDMRVAREYRIFTNVLNSVVDPKAFDPKSFVEFEGDVCIVPPNSFALARSVEYFRIPRDVVTICVGKSTYARCGIITNVTPFEPEWEGYVTLEISNTTPLPARIYSNEGIAQVLFFRGSEPPEVSYRDKKGKYQGQVGVTLPKL